MRMVIISVLALALLLALTLLIWRHLDQRADHAEMARLRALQPDNPPRFDHALISDLPEPARRFFTFAIAEGTPLYTVATVKMQGQISQGTKDNHTYSDMQATQVIAAPDGSVWAMIGGPPYLRIAVTDSAQWTRVWVAGIVPVAHVGGTEDHARSAFGRFAAEALFWTPAAVLPSAHVSWEGLSENVARMTIRNGTLEQSVDVTVAGDGRPTQVVFQRWSDENPRKIYQLQPFGGVLSEFQTFSGFRVPTRVEAGNHFGTDAYFPFFKATVTDLRFPTAQ